MQTNTESHVMGGPPSDPVLVDHADYIGNTYRAELHRSIEDWIRDRWRFSLVIFCEESCSACAQGWSLEQARSFLKVAVEDSVDELTRESGTKSFGTTGRWSS